MNPHTQDPSIPGRTIIIGTAATASALAAQLRAVRPTRRIEGCVLVGDRAPAGLPVLGTLEQLASIVRTLGVTTAIVSLPQRESTTIFQLRRLLRSLGVVERFVPPLTELIDPPASTSPRPVSIEPAPLSISGTPSPLGRRIDLAALIERDPHPIDREALQRVVTGRRVLVTGAGGSIGSELARISAALDPAELALMDRSENALFEIDRQLARLAPACPRRVVLHDVTDGEATRRLLCELRPDVVFHAAAHKHVPLMEDHPAAAVVNNVFGTRSIAQASIDAGVERFVLISTDKAVHPRSVMGATKRLAELTVQALHRSGDGSTGFSVVRFGNVLGSAGSVIPIWTAQIAEGGPLIVTDPRMTRYFMTIPEAAGLVVQAASLGGDSPWAPVFVLDMGEPIGILGLAERFARSHGLTPRVLDPRSKTPPTIMGDVDGPSIDILITGARPGEKLVEELAYEAEELVPTGAAGIRTWAGSAGETIDLASMFADLASAARNADHETVRAAIGRHIPELLDQVPLSRAS